MIPDMIILDCDDLHLVPASSGSVEQVVHHFQSIAGCIEIWKDPFYIHKQRCPPTEAPAYIFPLEKTVYYLAIVFSREKIHSPSFVD